MVQKDELKIHLLILQNYTQICITMVMSYVAFPKNHGTHPIWKICVPFPLHEIQPIYNPVRVNQNDKTHEQTYVDRK